MFCVLLFTSCMLNQHLFSYAGPPRVLFSFETGSSEFCKSWAYCCCRSLWAPGERSWWISSIFFLLEIYAHDFLHRACTPAHLTGLLKMQNSPTLESIPMDQNSFGSHHEVVIYLLWFMLDASQGWIFKIFRPDFAVFVHLILCKAAAARFGSRLSSS